MRSARWQLHGAPAFGSEENRVIWGSFCSGLYGRYLDYCKRKRGRYGSLFTIAETAALRRLIHKLRERFSWRRALRMAKMLCFHQFCKLFKSNLNYRVYGNPAQRNTTWKPITDRPQSCRRGFRCYRNPAQDHIRMHELVNCIRETIERFISRNTSRVTW